jgi:hypothetical protein
LDAGRRTYPLPAIRRFYSREIGGKVKRFFVFTGTYLSKKYLKKTDQPPHQPTKNFKTGVLMALIFESIQTDSIAHLSYLVGDDTAGIAAVFEPRPDVDCYLQLAREKQVAITHIFETHIHVDFVSGSRELGVRLLSRNHRGRRDCRPDGW